MSLLPERARRWLRAVTVDQWRAIDREWMVEPGFHPRMVGVLVVTSLVLIALEYFGSRSFFRQIAPTSLKPPGFILLVEYAWWCGACVLGYGVIPALVVKFAYRERLRDWGWRGEGFFSHLWIYALMFAGVFPLVVVASFTTAFQAKYPFYMMAARSWADLLAWELMYSAQFMALEFFFRGFMIFGLARYLGSAAIWVMTVPYAMIHFGKPVTETVGAIMAGAILGTVALRTRSIYAGILIHVAVAWSMDLLSLWHKGRLQALILGE